MSQTPLQQTPLPGAIMPMDEQERMVPKKTLPIANDRKPKPHYSDEGDKDQTIPI